jgi:hypothetical protein
LFVKEIGYHQEAACYVIYSKESFCLYIRCRIITTYGMATKSHIGRKDNVFHEIATQHMSFRLPSTKLLILHAPPPSAAGVDKPAD